MAELESRLAADIKVATRGRLPELQTLRLMRAALSNEAIARRAKGEVMSEPDQLAVLRRELKKRQEAAKLYEQGGRAELAAKELAEAKVIERYLPAQPAAQDIKQVAAKLKGELGLSGQAGLGQLTKALLTHYQGSIDGRQASAAARAALEA
ncbi:MAG: GatB/YqeY domain-containing protein [Candidatus Kerfeldbacteria bacterium]|nr:GatB/YqeY domain-containing protein [Candidatus Kerfeldbacteria bacterium]